MFDNIFEACHRLCTALDIARAEAARLAGLRDESCWPGLANHIVSVFYAVAIALWSAWKVAAELSWYVDALPRDSPPAPLHKGCDVVFEENRFLLVRVPVLWSRFGAARSKKRYDQHYQYYWVEDVREHIMMLNADLRFLGTKCVSIISCYPTSTKHIPDADNLDSKAITDAIVQRLGGDSWDRCTIYRAIIVRDDIRDGSYFIVTPGFDPPPLSNSIDIIKNHFRRDV